MVYWVDYQGVKHTSEPIYDEGEADRLADARMLAGARYYDPPRVLVLEL